MHLYSELTQMVHSALDVLQAQGQLPSDVLYHAVAVEPCKDEAHGDVATNAAMVLAKSAGKPPRLLAEALQPLLAAHPLVASVEIAGAGFLNLRLHSIAWQQVTASILQLGTSYGSSQFGHGERVNVEYVSANPTGPMHIGHARGAVVGDVLARLLSKAGYEVTKEYYINDAGSQIDVLLQSVRLRAREAMGEEITIPEGLYPGTYLIPIGQQLAARYGEDLGKLADSELRAEVVGAMLAMIQDDLAALGITHDVFVSEYDLQRRGLIEASLSQLEQKGLLYRGVLEPPKGKMPDDYEAREQLLFRSTQFGDDCDRAVAKSDGSHTYFAGDVAYHLDKISRGFTRLVLVLGADHGGYLKRLKAVVNALSGGAVTCDVVVMQLVHLLVAGQPLKMSKRAGRFVTLRDMVDELGKDALRFGLLTRKADVTLDFDVEKVVEATRENPVFYVQYAHARICSVLRHAADKQMQADVQYLSLLTEPAETQFMKKLAEWPRVVLMAAAAAEPHRLAYYALDVATSFHALWQAGHDQASMRFLQDDLPELTSARLALITAGSVVLRSVFEVMGVTPVEKL
jgi:arginyl-tRNA synthetase